jgi:hypothetical protein
LPLSFVCDMPALVATCRIKESLPPDDVGNTMPSSLPDECAWDRTSAEPLRTTLARANHEFIRSGL